MADKHKLHFESGSISFEGLAGSTRNRGEKSATVPIRELVQNALDAALQAGRGTPEDKAKVVFSIKKIPTSKLPGINCYRKALDGVKLYYEQGQFAGNDKNIFERLSHYAKGGGG